MLVRIGTYIGLAAFYDLEVGLMNKVHNLNKSQSIIKNPDYRKIKTTEERLGFPFNEQQLEAIHAIFENNVVLITGAAGTGKTSVIACVVDIIKQYSFMLCALSAKAADRMKEVSSENATTIHRGLGFNRSKFKYNQENPLPYSIIFVDEASMLDLFILKHLFAAIANGTKVVLIGDHFQLPPIGPGNFFKDLLDDPSIKKIHLQKIERQNEKSGIIMDSNKVKNSEVPFQQIRFGEWICNGELKDMFYFFSKYQNTLYDKMLESYFHLVKKYDVDSVCILLPRKKSKLGTYLTNETISYALNNGKAWRKQIKGDVVYRLTDKVIQRRNDYQGKNVFNGETGKVVSIVDNMPMEVEFRYHEDNVIYYDAELPELELAYALTVHLAQGSEYDHVILVLDTLHYISLSNQLLYTAMTRAKKQCIVIANPEAFRMAMETQQNRRLTFLSFLKHLNK